MLALIAGRGDLPGRIAALAGGPVLICGLQDQPPERVEVDVTFSLETLGSFLLELGQRGVTEICMAGGIERPVIDPARIDAETAPLVPLIRQALEQGDDGALRVVIDLFERTGFTVRGAHEVAPGIVAAPGIPTARQPRETHHEDAQAGDRILAEMGAADEGQACVIRKGVVIAREDARGTDAMLKDLALAMPDRPEMFRDGRLTPEGWGWLNDMHSHTDDAAGFGAIFFKGPKPEQDRRADMPAIGLETAILCAQAGFDGIVIKAGETIVMDEDRVEAVLDAAGMFLWSRA